MNKETLSNTALVVVTVCAVISTSMLVLRAPLARGAAADAVPRRIDSPVADWGRLTAGAHATGPADAGVVVLEFGDFECPFCKRFALTMKSVIAAHSNEVRFLYKHWPMPYHRFAYHAARISECAADQGAFWQAFHLLYEKQDSLGLMPWTDIGRRVGVRDTASFAACTARSDSLPKIAQSTAEAISAGGTGTPLVVVNGVRQARTPDVAFFTALVDSIRKQRSRVQ